MVTAGQSGRGGVGHRNLLGSLGVLSQRCRTEARPDDYPRGNEDPPTRSCALPWRRGRHGGRPADEATRALQHVDPDQVPRPDPARRDHGDVPPVEALLRSCPDGCTALRSVACSSTRSTSSIPRASARGTSAAAGYATGPRLVAELRGTEDLPDVPHPLPRAARGRSARRAGRIGASLGDDDVAEIDRRLDRLDRGSSHGPWTRAVLEMHRGAAHELGSRSGGELRSRNAAVQARRAQAEEPRADDQPREGVSVVAAWRGLPAPPSSDRSRRPRHDGAAR